jgi:hypothetical protein
MIKNIILVANSLDKKGLTKEADILDKILVKIAQAAEELEEDNSESDDSESEDIVSSTTAEIVRLSEEEPSEDRDRRLEELSRILEDNLFIVE